MPEARGRARERRAPAARDADVLGAVLRRHPAPVERVVEGRDGLAQLPDARDGRVLLIVERDLDALHARGRARQLVRLGLSLAEVAPGRVGRREPDLLGLGRDVDDPSTGYGAKGGVLVGHRRPRLPWTHDVRRSRVRESRRGRHRGRNRGPGDRARDPRGAPRSNRDRSSRRKAALAAHQTGRNSGVIHAGLYYKPGSLKARSCARGERSSSASAKSTACASSAAARSSSRRAHEEVPRLDELERRGRANGLAGVKRIGVEELREPRAERRGRRGPLRPGDGDRRLQGSGAGLRARAHPPRRQSCGRAPARPRSRSEAAG